jgi:hypothetical protein
VLVPADLVAREAVVEVFPSFADANTKLPLAA